MGVFRLLTVYKNIDLTKILELILKSCDSCDLKKAKLFSLYFYTLYTSENESVYFPEYRQILEKSVPQLFSGKFRVITEFGRGIFTKCGITVSKIFTIKGSDVDGSSIDQLRAKHNLNPILFAHVGSNVFFEEVYKPKVWRRRITAFNSNGTSKNIDNKSCQKYDIAGPLCFQGDYLCKEFYLPRVQVGDLLVKHDTGGYGMSLYSKFNSLQAYAVYGYSQKVGFKLLKEEESTHQCLGFWGPYKNPM